MVKMLETVATETHQIFGNYILDAVIRNKSYDALQACTDVPVSRKEYYKLYRRVFYILDRHRKESHRLQQNMIFSHNLQLLL